jgi:hypothetical protein
MVAVSVIFDGIALVFVDRSNKRESLNPKILGI